MRMDPQNPRQAFAAQMLGAAAMPQRDMPMMAAAPQGGVPPNYRESDNDVTTCGTCAHFDGKGACNQYGGYPVDAGGLCDTWEGASGAPEMAASGGM